VTFGVVAAVVLMAVVLLYQRWRFDFFGLEGSREPTPAGN
jgi:hypothetical protein